MCPHNPYNYRYTRHIHNHSHGDHDKERHEGHGKEEKLAKDKKIGPRDKIGNFVLYNKSGDGRLNFMSSVRLKAEVSEWEHGAVPGNTEGFMFEMAEQMLDEYTYRLAK